MQLCSADYIGNGVCNTVNNHMGCGFDGGDCCSYTCQTGGDDSLCMPDRCAAPGALAGGDRQPRRDASRHNNAS